MLLKCFDELVYFIIIIKQQQKKNSHRKINDKCCYFPETLMIGCGYNNIIITCYFIILN